MNPLIGGLEEDNEMKRKGKRKVESTDRHAVPTLSMGERRTPAATAVTANHFPSSLDIKKK